MSALPVAAKPGAMWPRVPVAFTAMALTIGLTVGLVVGATALGSRAAAPSVSNPVTPAARMHSAPVTTAPMATYRQLVADLKTAEARHDFAAQARFASQLGKALTPATIGAVYQEHARLVASLATAKAYGDHHSAARISQRLSAICGSTAVKAQLDFCN